MSDAKSSKRRVPGPELKLVEATPLASVTPIKRPPPREADVMKLARALCDLVIENKAAGIIFGVQGWDGTTHIGVTGSCRRDLTTTAAMAGRLAHAAYSLMGSQEEFAELDLDSPML